MGGSSSPPPAPDYKGAAEAQGASSQAVTNQQTYANRPDIYTPFGNQTYTQGSLIDPGTGQPVTTWQQQVSLDPSVQQALDSQQAISQGRSGAAQQLLGQATQGFQTPIDFNEQPSLFQFSGPSSLDTSKINAPALQTGVAAPGAFNEQAQRAMYEQERPLLEHNREATEAQLANQGITMGSEAWQYGQDQLARNENQAMLGATQAGFAQGNTEWNQGLQAGQFGNAALSDQARMQAASQAAQNQALSQQQGLNTGYGEFQTGQQQAWDQNTAYQRSAALNELNALLTGQQVQSPVFQGPSQAGAAQAVNHMGAAQNQYGSAMDAVAQSNANSNAQMQAAAGIAGAGLGAWGAAAGAGLMFF